MTLIRSAQEIWETALGQLEIQVTKPFYDTWLRGTVGMSFDDSSFMVGVSSPFVAESLQTRFLSLVKKAVADIIGEEVSLDFRVASQHPADVPRVQPSSTFESNGSSRRNGASLVRLNNKYTFDTFITGASNQLACAAARAVAGSPGIAYNPLFIYGGAGLGKTHLLKAVGHEINQRVPSCAVRFVTSEDFTH
ncbi:MAG: DnaA/Hda family protein, partial [Dehalococcoidia bacterium]|nr:DnaA/Hda family protein [Dehalococcoidia bacterium]